MNKRTKKLLLYAYYGSFVMFAFLLSVSIRWYRIKNNPVVDKDIVKTSIEPGKERYPIKGKVCKYFNKKEIEIDYVAGSFPFVNKTEKVTDLGEFYTVL